MLKTPRFIIPSDTAQAEVLDTERVLQFAVVNEALKPSTQTFITKIYNSIQRQDVQTLSFWSEEPLLANLKTDLDQSLKLDVQSYMDILETKNITKSSFKFNIIIDFNASTPQTTACVFGAWVCIFTYGIDDILNQPLKKSEFWNFLKHLKN